MGADGGASNSAGHVGRSGSLSSSEVPPLPQCLPLDPIAFQRYPYSGELRRVLGFAHGSSSDNHPYGFSYSKLSPPVTNEELKHYKDGVLDSSKKARERSKMFGESICKLDKYREVVGTKKRQRNDPMANEKPAGSFSLRMGNQNPRNVQDHSAHKLDNRNKSMGTNKRARSMSVELKVEGKSGMISRDQISNEKGRDVSKGVTSSSVQPEDRIRRLSAMGEGWDKKVKRKRSVAVVANRGLDNDGKQTIHSKLPPSDPRTMRTNTNQSLSVSHSGNVVKTKISRESRTGPAMLGTSSSLQASSDVSDGWEQPPNANKVQSLSMMHSRQNGTNSLRSMAQWVRQRPQKISRTRRSNVVSPISNYDEADDSSAAMAPPVFSARKSSNGNGGGSSTSWDADINVHKNRVKLEKTSSPNQLSECEDKKDFEHDVKEKGYPSADAGPNGNLKVCGAIFPTKKNRSLGDEDTKNSGWRQGKVGRALPLAKPSVPKMVEKLENISTTKLVPNMRPCNDKIKSKSGRPPSRKLAERKAFARAAESDDDREELLAAATSARKSSYVACVGRFWKKMEPIFGSVGSQDSSFLDQQLEEAGKLEESLSQISEAECDILSAVMENLETHSSQVSEKDDSLSRRFGAAMRSEKVSSLYQRVLSAFIEEDDMEGICGGGEVISTSFQCASDDSHCGSCNYNNDIEMRDRDRLESEAESRVDVHFQKHYAGDRFSCSKSVASNTSKNLSMSDSLYSSGRWQGDDGFSHSDVEFGSAICQSDVVGSQHGEVYASGSALSDSQYQLMCVDDKLVLELQSVGLFLEHMPDLAEEEEMVKQDIMELKEGLSQEVLKKKTTLVKINKAIQDDWEREKRYMEQVAMNQLIQMAYRRRMACRKTGGARTMTRKVSRQVAMGFIDRTLARCKKFELTGWSCFSEPSLQSVLFSPPQGCDTKSSDYLDPEIPSSSLEPPKHQSKAGRSSGSDPNTGSKLDPRADDFDKGLSGSPFGNSHASNFSSPRDDVALQKVKKKELLLDDVGGGLPSRKPTLSGAKGKRSERERFHSRDSMASNISAGTRVDPKTKSKLKQKMGVTLTSGTEFNTTTSAASGKPESIEKGTNAITASPGNGEELEEPIDFTKMPPPEFESLEQLGGPQDFSSWLDDDGLQDYDSMGLEIPMDDISDLMLM